MLDFFSNSKKIHFIAVDKVLNYIVKANDRLIDKVC